MKRWEHAGFIGAAACVPAFWIWTFLDGLSSDPSPRGMIIGAVICLAGVGFILFLGWMGFWGKDWLDRK